MYGKVKFFLFRIDQKFFSYKLKYKHKTPTYKNCFNIRARFFDFKKCINYRYFLISFFSKSIRSTLLRLLKITGNSFFTLPFYKIQCFLGLKSD